MLRHSLTIDFNFHLTLKEIAISSVVRCWPRKHRESTLSRKTQNMKVSNIFQLFELDEAKVIQSELEKNSLDVDSFQFWN